jgi:putative transcriptional regulator
MTTTRKFKSDTFQAIDTSCFALLKVDAITKVTMRDFDNACLAVPVPYGPKQINQIRDKNHVSQPVFAR